VTHPSPKSPTLLVLAAGLGSRYGGLKQMEAVGPGGATLMDYAVFDAVRTGFGKVVFVIRPELEAAFADQMLPRFRPHVPVGTVLQRLDAPPGFSVPLQRRKPWGTAHAVLAAAGAIAEPMVVVNADDFYGRAAYEAVAGFLREPSAKGPPAFALAGFRLSRTTSPAGPVNRAVCQVTAEGWLDSVVEVLNITGDRHGGFVGEERGRTRRYAGTELVSMNMWAFTPAVFDQLREAFRAFLGGATRPSGVPPADRGTTGRGPHDLEKREFPIPTVVQELVGAGTARVRVLPTDSQWTGITHPEDRPLVVAAIRQMVERGEYPERLWG